MHIVLVDGSRTGLLILHRMLESRGCDVAMFMDGQEALDYIRTTPEVDVLMTSFELATISGAELCWEARLLADAGRPIYVIAMSANTDAQHAIAVLDAGADDFMAKPPRPDELAARLRVAERTVRMQQRLIELATLDPLSGVLNRRAYRDKAEVLIGALPPGAPVSFILFDVDHFKRVNDVYGHDAGDEVIRQLGKLRMPPDALFTRLGGEEFGVLLADVPLEGAMSVADWLRGQIAGIEVPVGAETLSITASFGVAARETNETLDELYRRADAALYHAKHSGRNRVATLTAAFAA